MMLDSLVLVGPTVPAEFQALKLTPDMTLAEVARLLRERGEWQPWVLFLDGNKYRLDWLGSDPATGSTHSLAGE